MQQLEHNRLLASPVIEARERKWRLLMKKTGDVTFHYCISVRIAHNANPPNPQLIIAVHPFSPPLIETSIVPFSSDWNDFRTLPLNSSRATNLMAI